MAVTPEQLQIGPDFRRVPLSEPRVAEILAVQACLYRLGSEGDIVKEEDGSLSQIITLHSPLTHRVRRVKQFGVADINGLTIAKGDVSKGLVVAGYQLDGFWQVHGYLPAIRLPRIVNSRIQIGPEQKRKPEELREAAAEIRTANKVPPLWFDRYREEFPYLGVHV